MTKPLLRELLHRVLRAARGGRPPGRPAPRGRTVRSLAVEALEDRTLPSTLAPVAVFSPSLPPSDSAGGASQAMISADGQDTVFTSTAPNLVAGQVHTAVVQNVFLYNRQTRATTLVSHIPGSPLAEADSNSQNPRISSDGRYVVYESAASNLVTGQTGPRGVENVFLYDTSTGKTTLVSHRFDSPATSGSGNSTTAFTTGFGFNPNATRFLLFTSDATDLVNRQGGPNHLNLFLYDATLGTTTLVSHADAGLLVGTDADTTYADLTPDGSAVVFQSSAGDLVTGQVNEDTDNIFLYTTATGTARLVDGVAGGAGPSLTDAAGFSFRPVISADGSVISYVSGAPNLVAGQTPTTSDQSLSNNVFLYDALHGTTTLVSGAGGSASRTGNDNSDDAVLSSDGSTVAFLSGDTNLITGQTGVAGNVFVYNRPGHTLALASHVVGQPGIAAGSVGIRDTGTFGDLSLSADGTRVCYHTAVQDLVAQADNFGSENVFLYDASSGQNTLVSHASGAPTTGGERSSLYSRLSADGSTVAFLSFATNLDPAVNVADGGQNVFEFDVATSAAPVLASRSSFQASATSAVYGTSGDGRYVVFTSNAPNLVAGQVDTNFDQDVFLLDESTGSITLVSHVPGSTTTTGNAGSPGTLAGVGSGLAPVVSADGNWVAFVSQASNLVIGEDAESVEGVDQVYLFNRPTGAITLVSHDAGSATFVGADTSDSPVLSDDGRFVAFRSRAPDLIAGGDTGSFDTPNVYLYDRLAGTTTLVSHEADSATIGGDQASAEPTVSDDVGGTCSVAYESLATTLLPAGAALPSENVYRFDSATGKNTLVSHVAGLATVAPAVSSMGPVLSHDGSTVAFVSFATNLVSGQQPTPYSNVFLYQVAGGTISLVSGAGGSATTPAGGYSDSPALDDHGTVVAFRSDAPDVVAEQINTPGSTSNVFRFDPQAGTVTLVSHAAGSLATTTAAGNSATPALDGAGDLVVYLSTATNLVPGQQGGGVDNVFLYAVKLAGANALASGQGGSTVVPSGSPAFLALVSRDPVVVLNTLSGGGGASAGFINRLVRLLLSSSTVAGGSPPGTVVGTLSVDSVFAGQFLPPTYTLTPGADDDSSFGVGKEVAGTAPLVIEVPASYAARSSYQVLVDVDVGFGDDSALLQVTVAPPSGGRGGGGGGVTARLVPVRVGRKKKTRLMVELFDADTGALVASFAAPFQGPGFRHLQVSVRGGHLVVVTARKGPKTKTQTFAV